MLSLIAAADVVIASYDTLATENVSSGKQGLLLQTFFHRIILDEVQQVEGKADAAMNAKERVAVQRRTQAAVDLQASNRWCVSGTPLEAPDDVQAVLRFLRHQQFEKEAWWEESLGPALDTYNVPHAAAAEWQHLAMQYGDLKHNFDEPEASMWAYYESPNETWIKRKWNHFACFFNVVRSNYPSYAIPGLSTDAVHEMRRWAETTTEFVDTYDAIMRGRAWVDKTIRGVLEAQPKSGDAYIAAEVAKVTAEAMEVCPAVKRFGSGLSLLHALLKPIMWRNTQARVRELGQLSLPPVTEVVLSVRLSAGEEAVYNELLMQYQKGVVTQLRAALVDDAVAAADAQVAALGALHEANASLGNGGFAATNTTIEAIRGVAKQALWDLRSVCAHLSASDRLKHRLGLTGLPTNACSSLDEVMSMFAVAAEDKLQAACVEAAESAVRVAECAVEAVGKLRLLLQREEDELVDLKATGVRPFPTGFSESSLLTSAEECLSTVHERYSAAAALLGIDVNIDAPATRLGAAAGGGGAGAAGRKSIASGAGAGAGASSSASSFAAPPQAESEQDEETVARREEYAKAWKKLFKEYALVSSALEEVLNPKKSKKPKAGEGDGSDVDVDAMEVDQAQSSSSSSSAAGVSAGGDGGRKTRRAAVAAAAETKSLLDAQKVDDGRFIFVADLTIKQRKTRMQAATALIAGAQRKLNFAVSAASLTTRVKRWWEKKAAAGPDADIDTYGEDQDLRCTICLDPPPAEQDAALTPCCHVFCKECITSWGLQQNSNRWDPSGAQPKTLTGHMHAKCPCCNGDFQVSEMHTVAPIAAAVAGAAGSKGQHAMEVAAMLLSHFLSLAAGEGHAGAAASAGAGAGAAAPSSSSSTAELALPNSIASTTTVNTVHLTGRASLPPKSGNGESAAAAAAKKAVAGGSKASKAIDVYGGKIATLARRLKAVVGLTGGSGGDEGCGGAAAGASAASSSSVGSGTAGCNDKAIVATSWPHLRSIIAAALTGEGIPAQVLAGTPGEMAAAVQRFVKQPASESRVLVLAMGTDCSGLTLTAANHLFVLDPVLSPAVMAQLIGRICRQGQTKLCNVYHMCVAGSVEERMVRLHARLARGQGGAGKAGTEAIDASARQQQLKAKVDDANSASTDRLSSGELLALLDVESTMLAGGSSGGIAAK